VYDEPVRRIVAAWKERGLRKLAAWAAAIVTETLPRPETACLVYVPGDADRRLLRGHHAAERLGQELGEAWALPVEPLLERGPGSHRQRGLSRGDRRRNVAGAFRARARSPTKVTLVDDVYTTGATAHAAAAALRRAGAREVQVVAFARAIRLR
jgi:predicted amidophosphoribosyltransferase